MRPRFSGDIDAEFIDDDVGAEVVANDVNERPSAVRRRSKVKELAEEMSIRAVGSAENWDQYVEQAEGEVSVESYEKWLVDVKGWQPIESYDYPNADDRLAFRVRRYVHRLDPNVKKFVQIHRDAKQVWRIGAGPVIFPYNLPELVRRKAEPIVLCEGEKGANRAKKAGLLATCVQGQRWTDNVAAYFADRDVIILPNRDEAGEKNTEKALKILAKVGARTRIVRRPGLKWREDEHDWLEAGHTKEELLALAAAAPLSGLGALTAPPHPFPDEAKIPMWEFLYGHHLMRHGVGHRRSR